MPILLLKRSCLLRYQTQVSASHRHCRVEQPVRTHTEGETMSGYSVIFRADHEIEDFNAPDGCDGEVVGEVQGGQLGVYEVPDELEQEFLDAVKQCKGVSKCKKIDAAA